MSGTHAFVISSIKDLTSTVLLEALSLGLPVVAPNHCGFPDVVHSRCGILVSVESPETMIEEMAQALCGLADDEEYRRRLAQGARRRAMDFLEDTKIRELETVYAAAVSRGAARSLSDVRVSKRAAPGWRNG